MMKRDGEEEGRMVGKKVLEKAMKTMMKKDREEAGRMKGREEA